eukprot:391116_1
MHSGNCTNLADLVYNTYVLPTITIIAAASVVYIMFLYIKIHIMDDSQSPKELYLAGLVFFTMILLFYIIQTNKFIFYCHHPYVSNVFSALDVQAYIFQMLILIGILFYRVWIVFTNS